MASERDDTGHYQEPEGPLGGADAAPKTSYVVGSGTEPEATAPPVTARVRPGGGVNPLLWVVVVLAVLLALVYGFGIAR